MTVGERQDAEGKLIVKWIFLLKIFYTGQLPSKAGKTRLKGLFA